MTRRHRLVPLVLILLLVAPGLWAQDGDDDDPPMSDEYRAKWTTDPGDVDERWQEAVRLRFIGDVDGAIELYKVFLSENEDEVSTTISMGMALWEKGSLAEAEEWFRKAKVMVPKHIKARQFLGQMLFHTGRFTEAKQEFLELEALEWNRPDVLASARLNLGKLALLERDWSAADTWFEKTGQIADKGARSQAGKGRALTMSLRRTYLWSEEIRPHVKVYFSPRCREARNPASRTTWADEAEASFTRVLSRLGMEWPEPIPLYVVADAADVYGIMGLDRPHTWKYSWYLLASEWDGDKGHNIAHHLVARVRGNRPSSKLLVEGLCIWLDDDRGDPHAGARDLLKQDRLPTIARLHLKQRYDLENVSDVAGSFVSWLIDTYGLEKFLESYVRYILVNRDPSWIDPNTLRKDWGGVLSKVFRMGIGEDLPTLESRWRAFLRQ